MGWARNPRAEAALRARIEGARPERSIITSGSGGPQTLLMVSASLLHQFEVDVQYRTVQAGEVVATPCNPELAFVPTTDRQHDQVALDWQCEGAACAHPEALEHDGRRSALEGRGAANEVPSDEQL
jgi:hypothetical protein